VPAKHAIKLKGKGTPILAKQSDFAVFFGNNICAFSITPTGSGVLPAVAAVLPAILTISQPPQAPAGYTNTALNWEV
jgi:hypothetical protein